MADTALSRRVSEFTGVVLFAGALIWFIALVDLPPVGPGLVLQRRPDRRGRELRRAVRRLRRARLAAARRLHRLPAAVHSWLSSAGTTSGAGRSTPATPSSSAPCLFVICLAGLMALAFSAFAPADGDGSTWRRHGSARPPPSVLSRLLQPNGRGDLPAHPARRSRSSCPRSSRSAAPRRRSANRVRATPGLLDRWSEWQGAAPARTGAATDHRQARQEGRQGTRARNRHTRGRVGRAPQGRTRARRSRRFRGRRRGGRGTPAIGSAGRSVDSRRAGAGARAAVAAPRRRRHQPERQPSAGRTATPRRR